MKQEPASARYGTCTILVKTAESGELLFKHAILSIGRMPEDTAASES